MDAPTLPDSVARFSRRQRASLGVLVVAWGAQAIVTQTLLLREATVLMYGSEFAWGIVLFAWLLGVALGAALGGRLAESSLVRTRAYAALVIVLLLLGAAACAELWVFRGARAWLGVGPGELLPLPKTALAAMLLVSPASALVGLAFPLACCSAGPPCPAKSATTSEDVGHGGPTLLSFGQIYALESLGSLFGGAVFTFWAVEHLAPIRTALLSGALTAAAAAFLLRAARRPAFVLSVMAVAATLVAILAGSQLNRALVARRWQNLAPGYKLVAEAESKYQNLAVGRRAGQYSLYSDGHVSADFPDPYTFAPLAHFWLCEHPAPRNVLLLGGGAEGLLSELLQHPLAHVDYVEPDPRQIELLKPFLADADRQALADPRVAVHHVDARYFVKTQRDRFDLVIARLPEPISALRARFYTDEFYGELRRAMTASAVLCLTAAAAPTELSPMSRAYLASLRATLRRHFLDMVVGWGDPAPILAATQSGLVSTDPAELAARYTRRGVHAALFDPAWFAGATDWLAPDKLARRAADLDAAGCVAISTDLHPLIYLQRLAIWEAQTSSSPGRGSPDSGPRQTGLIARLHSVRLPHLALALALLGGLTLAASRLRGRASSGWAGGAITVSVGSTGLVTMALSIVWLFAFQNLYGYVYQRIGWIIALFMAGLVLGCLWASRVGRASPNCGTSNGERCPPCVWRCLIAVDVLLALLALATPFVLSRLGALQSSPGAFALVEACISLLVIVTGVLGGAAFPLAGRLQLTLNGCTGGAAASVVSADHAGACLGALLCGILLVPVFGTATTALLLAGIKISSAGLLMGGRWLHRVA